MPLVPHVSSGQIVASSWGNLVADAVVMRFTTAAQRASLLTAPILNQLTLLDDRPGVLWYWTGSAWAEYPRRTGFGALNGGQNINSGATAASIWSTEDFDTDNYGAPGSATITLPSALGGIYSITTYVAVGGSPTAPSRVQILVAGAVVAGDVIPNTIGPNEKTVATTREIAGGATVVVNIINGNPGVTSYSATIRLLRVGP